MYYTKCTIQNVLYKMCYVSFCVAKVVSRVKFIPEGCLSQTLLSILLFFWDHLLF